MPSVQELKNEELQNAAGGNGSGKVAVIDDSFCNGCGMCVFACPDGSIVMSDNGHYRVKYDYCQGCGACCDICGLGIISLISR